LVFRSFLMRFILSVPMLGIQFTVCPNKQEFGHLFVVHKKDGAEIARDIDAAASIKRTVEGMIPQNSTCGVRHKKPYPLITL
jgi:hypothetical protein